MCHKKPVSFSPEQVVRNPLFSLLSVGFRALGEQVGLPGGFGHAIAFAAGQGELDGLGQINLLWPIETKTGWTPSRVRTAAPITRPSSS